ncbi:hypothetical protein STCU_00116 [Strigomonas culicis]|uniref:Uncharacterized protein n=1 Tax=Strigomonas culicis TaxID=28005 RepID=S9WDI0_9TRYP|nr:hypothetical protein STCU_00116 [Strigomonas culicis]|eukprot:EPY37181.1 hypothetical protein STCU_00116 [Strigomonas culicis]
MRRLISLVSPPLGFVGSRAIATNGRVTNEDRRWWLIHLECAPDITPGTFVSWLDCCGTHTTKKLIERNLWTIEQVADLDSDQVDELKYKEGCLKMDVVWEHARTIITPLRQREVSGGVESELQNRILELRKKRELERKRAEIVSERSSVNEAREATLQKLRDSIAAKKAALREKMQRAQARQAGGDAAPEDPVGESVSSVMDRVAPQGDATRKE